MPLAEAIRKITLAPAATFGLAKRGEIKEGNFADLVLFQNDAIRTVIVNGRIALRDGIVQNNLAGHILRHANH